MKKRLILPIIICILLLVIGKYIYDVNIRFDEIDFEYLGIDGKTFYVELDTMGLECRVEPSANIKNGDTVSLICGDSLTGLLKFNRYYQIEGLLYDVFDSDDFLRLVSSKIATSSAYAKTDDNGIHLLVLSSDENNYYSTIYDNLYYSDDVLYQITNIYDQRTYSKTILPSTTLTNIQPTDLNAYIKLVLDEGYIEIGKLKSSGVE